MIAKGALKTPYRNKTEEAYAKKLELATACGEVAWWAYEGISVKLAEGAHYRCDFAVMLPDGTFEFHEVKGFWREAARVRIKVASSLYPFRFIAVKKNKAGWEVEEF